MNNPTTRFSDRVENYVKYRPTYPPEALRALEKECGFNRDAVVADVGCGTGIFSRVLLENGNRVFGVEPNAAMRAAVVEGLAGFERFRSVDGTAEATTLPDRSVQFVTAAQALHWFKPEPTRAEFARILQPGGWVGVLWTERRLDTTPFLRDYEELLRTFGTDYAAVRQSNLDVNRVRTFFGTDAVKLTVLSNGQTFDCEGLVGRTLSSSYAPEKGHLQHERMLARLRNIFEQHQTNGVVSFEYDLNIYTAQLDAT